MKRHSIFIPALLIIVGIVGTWFYSMRSHVPITPFSTMRDSAAANSRFIGMVDGSSGGWTDAMGSGMVPQVSREISTLTSNEAKHDMDSSLTHAIINKRNNSITYSGKVVNIVLLGGAMDDHISGPAEKFIIGGLANPAIHVPKNAKITLELVNEDTDMPHGVDVSSAEPPYEYMPMMQGDIYPGSVITPIPEAHDNRFPVASTTFSAVQSGTYYYLCQYPGHAEEGMYGKLVIGS